MKRRELLTAAGGLMAIAAGGCAGPVGNGPAITVRSGELTCSLLDLSKPTVEVVALAGQSYCHLRFGQDCYFNGRFVTAGTEFHFGTKETT
jgi:hypothetical protein